MRLPKNAFVAYTPAVPRFCCRSFGTEVMTTLPYLGPLASSPISPARRATLPHSLKTLLRNRIRNLPGARSITKHDGRIGSVSFWPN